MKVLLDMKGYLKKKFDMKDFGEANYILGIKLYSRKLLQG